MRTFRIGGIHLPDNKLSASRPIQMIPLPETVIIPLDQHIGAPASVVVAKGDKVKAGTMIGKAECYFSANIHSSVFGTVTKVDNMLDGYGIPHPAVYIKTEGDEWEQDIDCSETLVKDCNFSAAEIIQKIETAGIVGMGGAGFPTKNKLLSRSGKKAEVLIINASECEPYMTADHALMLEKSEEILVGATLLTKALNVNRTIIGIEDNKPDAIAFLTRVSAAYKEIEVASLKTQYPQGGEKQLIDALLHRQVKSGKYPISVGVIVQNVATAFAVYEAVQKNKPLIERVITVTGKNVVKPSNFLVRIGTPISTLIDATGGIPENTGKIINGGPMMGKAMINISAPVTKNCSGILLITKEESRRRPIHDCIRCSKCFAVCPMGLEPSLLTDLAENKMWEKAEKCHITDCIDCGSCSYTCPSGRPLADYIQLGKTTVLEMKK